MSSTALESLKASIEQIILDPKYRDVLAIVKGARNGAVYGAKVRFPHALVMMLLFRSGTLREKAKLIFRATKTHALNLAKFATIYKTVCYLLKYYGTSPGKEGPYDSFFAGLLGGYVVFGQRSRKGKISSVSQQIVIYVFARVVLALARLAVKPGYGFPGVSEPNNSTAISHYAWPVFAAVSWASVMHLFRWHDAELQSSLRSSMVYIYKDSDTWDGLRNFIWHNK
ncbi:Tim17/Tim22/Tim23/Pmp24 family-domain-containing protein [Pseudoneurospora amorphoporcata]|uniref:Tim17/Tim22/Tim23/Pmp24 family-domain-containing protein n=1 Tax=Pseudoneurospora amorphoporcata TaxID=241081 RepID=A0AAN6SJH1_9PEZI|nr:Tim17/Tim22/Tim23/Pmp24 family-domain-containing protein [Pseudoneurospora amorphoporcata]